MTQKGSLIGLQTMGSRSTSSDFSTTHLNDTDCPVLRYAQIPYRTFMRGTTVPGTVLLEHSKYCRSCHIGIIETWQTSNFTEFWGLNPEKTLFQNLSGFSSSS